VDVGAAALHRKGLIDGVTAHGPKGPIRSHLTDDGEDCCEHFGADVQAWEQRKQNSAGVAINAEHSRDAVIALAIGEHISQQVTVDSGGLNEQLREVLDALTSYAQRQGLEGIDELTGELQDAKGEIEAGRYDGAHLGRWRSAAQSLTTMALTAEAAVVVPLVNGYVGQLLDHLTK